MKQEKFLDEQIIDMINQVEKSYKPKTAGTGEAVEKKPEERTISTGIKILGKRIEFEPRLFVQGHITMMVPTNFNYMEADTAKFKYPSEQRPETILVDNTGTVNILFNHMDEGMNNADAEMVRNKLIGIMCRVNPGIKPQSTGVEVISDKNVAYIEFSNPVMDGKLYNLMFFMEVAGRILMGSFNCRTKDIKYWKEPAFQMMRSIQVSHQLEEREESE